MTITMCRFLHILGLLVSVLAGAARAQTVTLLPDASPATATPGVTVVTVTGSNMVEVRDSYTKGFVTALTDAGLAPRGTVLGPAGKLFVQGSMERSIVEVLVPQEQQIVLPEQAEQLGRALLVQVGAGIDVHQHSKRRQRLDR